MTKKDQNTRRDIAAIIAVGRHNHRSSVSIAEEILIEAHSESEVIESVARWFETCGNGLYRPREAAQVIRGLCKEWILR